MSPVLLSVDAMATRFELVLHGLDPVRLRAAGEEALAEVVRLDRLLSFYRADSEITDVNQRASEEPVRVSVEVFRLLATCAALARTTSGAFDTTVGPLMRAWKLAGGDGAIPEPADLDRARAATGTEHLLLDEEAWTVRFGRPGMAIDLGAAGKGYAVDVAIDRLRDAGVTSALLHGGTSSVHAIGAPPGEDAWRIAAPGAAPPGDRPGTDGRAPAGRIVRLRDQALAVSAQHGKFFVHDGRVYGHVLDPRTGAPVPDARAACVAGPSSLVADALATALLVQGDAWLPAMRQQWPDYQAWVA